MRIRISKERMFIIGLGIILFICSIAIAVGIYAQITDSGLFARQPNEEEKAYEALKSNFDSIFDNTVHTVKTLPNANVDYSEAVESLDFAETISGRYDIDVSIPYFTLESEVLNQENAKIREIFIPTIMDIAQNAQVHTIYNIKYVAYVNNNILSLVVKCTWKDGASAQRVLIHTTNYDIVEDRILTLEDLIEVKDLKQGDVQKKINKEIKAMAEQMEAISMEGYNIFKRNPEDEEYKIENTTVFFLGDKNVLYIIYAYGNKEFTSQRDLVLF